MSKDKSILFISPSAYPLGGVAVWLEYLTKELPCYNWKPIVGLVEGKWHNINNYQTHYPRLPIIAINNPTGSIEGRIRALIKTIGALNPDIVVGINIVDLYAASYRLKSSGCRTKFVISLHGIAEDLLTDLKQEASGIDAVIATNYLTCKLCNQYSGLESKRIYYSPYGVDINSLSKLPRLTTDKTKINIAWVGRLEQDQKHIYIIPEILRQMDKLGTNYILRIAGDGPDRQTLISKLHPWLETGKVEYLGVFKSNDVGHNVYAKSDIFLLTSYWETGPIVIWEAMAAGIAIVSSRYIGSGLENALQHENNCLLFPIDDAIEAAQQISRLQDSSYRNKLVTNAQMLIENRYSISHSTRSWVDCFNQILQVAPCESTQKAFIPTSSGRLDRIFGVGLGESIRKFLQIQFKHNDPGGEWPHTATAKTDETLFLRYASTLETNVKITGIS
jgi:glycosyltransferase involved in cell wall biosynthesis